MRRYKRFRRALLIAACLFATSPSCAQEPQLIDIQNQNPKVLVDIRYKTKDNFVGEILYPQDARILLRREAAEALLKVQEALQKRGLGLKIYDGYRPLSVQKKMWAKYPVEGYVANPAKGSNHNRGMAVDLTLVDTQGKELSMPSGYDEFSERAHRNYTGGTQEERNNRQILQEAMEAEGFGGITTEWWHFDFKNAKDFPVLDLPFAQVEKN